MQPWYSQKAAADEDTSQQVPDTGQQIALTAGTDLLLTDAAIREHKHSKHRKDKKDKKEKHSNKDGKHAKVKSVEELRAERQDRESTERRRQDRLLQVHRGFAGPVTR